MRVLLRRKTRGNNGEHIERCPHSGLSQAEYCRPNGLMLSAFYYWKRRLKPNTSPLTLVQVPVDLGGCRQDSHGHQLILVVGNRYTVELRDNLNPSTLRRVGAYLGAVVMLVGWVSMKVFLAVVSTGMKSAPPPNLQLAGSPANEPPTHNYYEGVSPILSTHIYDAIH